MRERREIYIAGVTLVPAFRLLSIISYLARLILAFAGLFCLYMEL